MPGMALHARYTVFCHVCRGQLAEQLIQHFQLDQHADTPQYGIGMKELWDIDPALHQEGLVVHTAGWPLTESSTPGGAFLYHIENHQVALGLIADLSYSNPH